MGNCSSIYCVYTELLMHVYQHALSHKHVPPTLLKSFVGYYVRANGQPSPLIRKYTNICFPTVSQISCCLNLCWTGVSSIGLQVMSH